MKLVAHCIAGLIVTGIGAFAMWWDQSAHSAVDAPHPLQAALLAYCEIVIA